jgi:hypothetical protein
MGVMLLDGVNAGLMDNAIVFVDVAETEDAPVSGPVVLRPVMWNGNEY